MIINHFAFEQIMQIVFQLYKNLFSGDEILSVNGHSTHGLSHSEAIAIFKGIRSGKVTIHIARRDVINTR